MDMRKHLLIYLFISMLVGKERGEIIIRIRDNYQERSEIIIRKEVK
jgi:hypothetical protein